MVVQVPKAQAGEVVGLAVCDSAAHEDTIQVHLQGAAPDKELSIRLVNAPYPEKNTDDPVWIETVEGPILTDSQGNGRLHAVTRLLERGYVDWVDMKVVTLALALKYSAWVAPLMGAGLPPKR